MIVIFLILAWLNELASQVSWNKCWLYKGDFFYTFFKNSLTVEANIHDEQHIPFWIIRFFNNKPITFIHGVLQALLQYGEVRFLLTFISFIGVVGLYYAFWKAVTEKKSMWLLIPFAILLISCVVEIVFVVSFPVLGRFTFLAIIYQVISLFGLYKLYVASSKKGRALLWITLVISMLLLITFPQAYQEFCLLI